MATDSVFHITVAETKRRLRATQPRWTWRATDHPGWFQLWHDGEHVGTLSISPGQIHQRAALLDVMVDHLNHPPT